MNIWNTEFTKHGMSVNIKKMDIMVMKRKDRRNFKRQEFSNIWVQL